MKIRINGMEVEAQSGETILEVARRNGIDIPTLCYHKAFGGQGACRFCMVAVTVNGNTRIVASCTYPVSDGLEVQTSNPRIDKIRGNIAMMLYKRAPNSVFMQSLYKEYHCADNALTEDPHEKCILCRLCVNACAAMGLSSIATVMRGTDKRISTPYDEASTVCIGCAACAEVCPTGAIQVEEDDKVRHIWNRDFTMVACEKCGKNFATREQINYIATKNNQDPDDISLRLCENCRGKMVAQKFSSFNM
jgi:bidirectional [NiFe] hydrogenase diaphorase subunit